MDSETKSAVDNILKKLGDPADGRMKERAATIGPLDPDVVKMVNWLAGLPKPEPLEKEIFIECGFDLVVAYLSAAPFKDPKHKANELIHQLANLAYGDG